MKLVGRNTESKILASILESNDPEFLALYGRRRVGKTFLIKQFFKEKDVIFFNVTGSQDGSYKEQILNFTKQIGKVFYGGVSLQPCSNWNETFELLTKAMDSVNKNKKIVLFFDELPWMATKKSRLLQNIDYYWNQYWSDNEKIKLIVCGSSASWIINNIINNRGGLHNRITKKLNLKAFNLYDTRAFLKAKGINLTDNQVLMLYMVTGGIPYYLSQLKKGFSATQLIELLAFSENSLLLNEFDNLFSSLFKKPELYIQAIRELAKNRGGLGKRELLISLGKTSIGGTGIKVLKDLENAGFIISFKPHFHKRQGIYYRLIDEYTLFYLKWIEPLKETLQKQSLDEGNFQAMQNSPEWQSWLGYAFENVCYRHISGIRKALKISPSAIANSWRYVPKKGSNQQGAQIDLLFDRKDAAITLCEIKYSQKPYSIDKNYAEILKRKSSVFKKQTRTNKQLFISLITANGIKNNMYANEIISGYSTIEDLFYSDN